jgi:hypothetical protein
VRFRLPPDLYGKIIESAEQERRSANSEVILILERHYEQKEKASGSRQANPDASDSE